VPTSSRRGNLTGLLCPGLGLRLRPLSPSTELVITGHLFEPDFAVPVDEAACEAACSSDIACGAWQWCDSEVTLQEADIHGAEHCTPPGSCWAAQGLGPLRLALARNGSGAISLASREYKQSPVATGGAMDWKLYPVSDEGVSCETFGMVEPTALQCEMAWEAFFANDSRPTANWAAATALAFLPDGCTVNTGLGPIFDGRVYFNHKSAGAVSTPFHGRSIICLRNTSETLLTQTTTANCSAQHGLTGQTYTTSGRGVSGRSTEAPGMVVLPSVPARISDVATTTAAPLDNAGVSLDLDTPLVSDFMSRLAAPKPGDVDLSLDSSVSMDLGEGGAQQKFDIDFCHKLAGATIAHTLTDYSVANLKLLRRSCTSVRCIQLVEACIAKSTGLHVKDGHDVKGGHWVWHHQAAEAPS